MTVCFNCVLKYLVHLLIMEIVNLSCVDKLHTMVTDMDMRDMSTQKAASQ